MQTHEMVTRMTPRLDEIIPPEPTATSSRYHLEIANAERAAVCPHLRPQEPIGVAGSVMRRAAIRLRMVQMPIPPSRLELDARVRCAEIIDAAVEEFGLQEVLRHVRAIADLNEVEWS